MDWWRFHHQKCQLHQIYVDHLSCSWNIPWLCDMRDIKMQSGDRPSQLCSVLYWEKWQKYDIIPHLSTLTSLVMKWLADPVLTLWIGGHDAAETQRWMSNSPTCNMWWNPSFLCVSLWKQINRICTITCMAFILILSLKLLLSYVCYFAVVHFINYDNTWISVCFSWCLTCITLTSLA